MKANETKFEDFLSSNKTQFIIPVYQRNYDWTQSECKQLLNDIINAGNDNINAHFIGSIVFIHDDVYNTSRIKELTIIDGQQRLSTITLIYIVLYSLAKELKNENLANEISETYLINKFGSDEEKLKLRPTENNDRALKYLLRDDPNEEFTDFSKLVDNYNYFKRQINRDNYKTVQIGLSKLMFVEVSLDREKDDPQRIFESLNSTGLELSQADLIRNYILMGLKRNEQARIYDNYWEIIESNSKDEKTNENRVSDFIRDYLTLVSKNIPNKNKVYQEFKIKYPTTSLENLEIVLNEIKSLVKYYNKLLNPQNEQDQSIRIHLEYINRLEINVIFPFLMKVYEDFGNSIINKSDFISILELIQSFVWRRFIVGLPTSSLNKVFMVLYEKIEKNNYLTSLQKALLRMSGNNRFPKDHEVINALKDKDVYNIKSKNRTYLLERLENFENSEFVEIENNPNITVEHIFPQNPDPKWKLELSTEEYNDIKENYLNTISNLTLSGNNAKLGNKSFLEKRDLPEFGYKSSRLFLNKYLSNIDKWNKEEMDKRFEEVSVRFLQVWPLPNILLTNDTGQVETNIFDADEPSDYKKLEYAIFFNERIDVKDITKLYVEIVKRLFELQPETFFNTDLASKLKITKKPENANLRQPEPINDTYFIEKNIGSNQVKFDRIRHMLIVFGLEDELLIKYQENNF